MLRRPVGHTGGLEPESVESLAEVRLVIGMQAAGQEQADLVNVAGQVNPAIHDFARAAGIDDIVHFFVYDTGVSRSFG